ncbi:MAG TPA: STAS domain-containing protein [Candidatus Dormibacteraeota bacterium]|nr:STAS domain-containing protein [Candidatus Dormibacteraeota bacterium]
MTELVNVRVETREDVQVALLAGEVDISNATRLQTDIAGIVPNDASGLVLDLSDIEYLDSAGIRMLFELHGRLSDRRQRLAAVVPEDSLIRGSLLVTEVDQALVLRPTLDEAIAAVRGGHAAD